MIISAKVQLYVSCPSCTEGTWRVDHLQIGQDAYWTCSECHKKALIQRVSKTDFSTTPFDGSNRRETPVVVTLQSVTEPKITVKLNSWKYEIHQDDTPEEYAHEQRYFYNQHTCPTNWIGEIVEIIFKGDRDPHGVFEFVSVEDGHLVDGPEGMVLDPGK